jgi:hypothetical protein
MKPERDYARMKPCAHNPTRCMRRSTWRRCRRPIWSERASRPACDPFAGSRPQRSDCCRSARDRLASRPETRAPGVGRCRNSGHAWASRGAVPCATHQSAVSAGSTESRGVPGEGGDAREAFGHEGATLRRVIEGLLQEGQGFAGKRMLDSTLAPAGSFASSYAAEVGRVLGLGHRRTEHRLAEGETKPAAAVLSERTRANASLGARQPRTDLGDIRVQAFENWSPGS